jgi:hypothetical protein
MNLMVFHVNPCPGHCFYYQKRIPEPVEGQSPPLKNRSMRMTLIIW